MNKGRNSPLVDNYYATIYCCEKILSHYVETAVAELTLDNCIEFDIRTRNCAGLKCCH